MEALNIKTDFIAWWFYIKVSYNLQPAVYCTIAPRV